MAFGRVLTHPGAMHHFITKLKLGLGTATKRPCPEGMSLQNEGSQNVAGQTMCYL
jgi:hypothetical protein